MWCEGCSQEVPGVARPGNRQLIVCPRCEHSLLTAPPVEVSFDPQAKTPTAEENSPPIFEDDSLEPLLDSLWEQEAWAAVDRDADRLLRSLAEPAPAADLAPRRIRVDGPQASRPPHLAWPASLKTREESATRRFRLGKIAVLLGAVGMLVGGAMAVYGGTLQQSSWRIAGLAAASVGQLLIFSGGLGLLIALRRLHQVMHERVARLDREVATLRQQTSEAEMTRDVAQPTRERRPSAMAGREDHALGRAAATGRDGETLLLVDKLRRQLDRLAERVDGDRPAA